MLNCHSFKSTFKGSTPCLIWLWTTSHLKYYSYHIHYPNLVYFSSLESWLQGSPSYQIISFVAKPIISYATKLEGVCKLSLRLQAPNTIPIHFHSFKTITTSNLFSFFIPSTKINHSSPTKEGCENKSSQDSSWKLCSEEKRKKKPPNDPNSPF
jgi:hypothetical protein